MAIFPQRSNGNPVYLTEANKYTYSISFQVAPTAAMDVFSIYPGTGRVIRLRRLVIDNPGAQTTAALVTVQLGFASGVQGTGGAAVSPRVLGIADSDPASGVVARSGDTTVSASFTQVIDLHVWVPAAAAATLPIAYDFDGAAWKGFGTSSLQGPGMVLRHPGAAGGANFSGHAIFTSEIIGPIGTAN